MRNDRLKNGPNVLVLLATYNGERWIRPQVQSILEQTDVDLDILWSDDGSTDSTAAIMDDLIKMNPGSIRRAALFSARPSAALNFIRLIINADIENYEYIAFADQDDVWSSSKLHKSITILRSGPFDFCSHGVFPFGNRSIYSGASVSPTSTSPRVGSAFFSPPSQGCTYMMTAEVALEFRRYFCNRLSELSTSVVFHDWLLCCFTVARGFNWVHSGERTVFYRQHHMNVIGQRDFSIRSFLKRLKLLTDGRYFRQLLFHFSTVKCHTDRERTLYNNVVLRSSYFYEFIARSVLPHRLLLNIVRGLVFAVFVGFDYRKKSHSLNK